MIDIQALIIIGVPVEMRHLMNTIDRVQEKNAALGSDDRNNILLPHAKKLKSALASVGARSALICANRMDNALENNVNVTYATISSMLSDIESRFADHLGDIKLLYLNQNEAALFDPAENLLAFDGNPINEVRERFPNSCFEIEECAKCLALGRHTASVFHAMRVMEIGLGAFAKHLGISDPAKANDRSWGVILKSIKSKIDDKWPSSTRLPETEGAKMDAIYVTIDSVKNPWRNTTMHVEQIYAPHEATHIARCTGMFILELMKNSISEKTA